VTRVLVTGGTGFIGSRVLAQLVDTRHHVTVLRRSVEDATGSTAGYETIVADILAGGGLEDAVREAAPELCLHLAWYTQPSDYQISVLNRDWLSGSLDLLAALDAAGCRRTLMAGTCLEYATHEGPISESMSLAPTSAYSSTKHELRLRATSFQAEAGRSFVWPRVFYLYGPGERPERLVPMAINRLLAGEPCALTKGTQVRDYLHVDDVAAALVAVAQSDIEGPVNIGSGAGVTVAEVARTIGDIIGASELLRFGAIVQAAGDPASVVADTTLLRSATAWRPARDLRTGLSDTVDWWRSDGGSAPAGGG
jgi:nucleoside-diphosphate-sugar epimerase